MTISTVQNDFETRGHYKGDRLEWSGKSWLPAAVYYPNVRKTMSCLPLMTGNGFYIPPIRLFYHHYIYCQGFSPVSEMITMHLCPASLAGDPPHNLLGFVRAEKQPTARSHGGFTFRGCCSMIFFPDISIFWFDWVHDPVCCFMNFPWWPIIYSKPQKDRQKSDLPL